MTRTRTVLAVLALLAWCSTFRWDAAGEEEPPRPAPWSEAGLRERYPDPDPKPAADPDAFAGSLECLECHEDRWNSLKTSFHAELLKGESAEFGCESCHGPGFAHFEDGGEAPIRHPGTADAVAVVGLCLRCHTDVLAGPVGDHRAWVSPDGPTGRTVSCTQCHEVHVDRESPAFDEKLGPFRTAQELSKVAEHVPAKRCIECHPDFHPRCGAPGTPT